MLNNFYNGNPKIKKVGVPQKYTQKQIDEYEKCRDDIVYFASKYCKIISLDEGLINFEPRDYQKRLLNDYAKHRFNIVLTSRQTGKTISTAAFLIHYLVFNSHKAVALVANKAKLAREILHRMKRMYEGLPFFLQPGVIEWNKSSVELGNGSTVAAGSTTSDTIRGFSFNMVMVDEAAFIDGFEEFYASTYPVISSGKTSKLILISTPNGINLFYKLWKEANLGQNTFNPTRVDWHEVPHYDEAWKAETIKNIGQKRFDQEYGNKFYGSNGTLISGAKLEELTWVDPLIEDDTYREYAEVKKGHNYIITVDPSEGVEEDYSVCTVLDVTTFPYTQAAVYRNNKIQPLVLPEIIIGLANKFNEAYVLVETNNIGSQIGSAIYYDYEYENIITSALKYGENELNVSSKSMDFGLRMTKKSKLIGCSNLKQLIESDKLEIQDFDTIEELNTFIRKGKSYEAEKDKHDDLVMTLVSFAWLTTQPFFEDLFDINVKKEVLEKIRGNSMPIGVGFMPTDNIELPTDVYVPDYGIVPDKQVNNIGGTNIPLDQW